MHELVPQLMALFEGKTDAFGVYLIRGPSTGDKVTGQAATLRKEVTVELWDKHLSGDQGLGIIPIRDDSMVKFGTIDIDDYAVDHVHIIQMILSAGLPLVPTRSKSGGLHLWIFLTEFTEAFLVQKKLHEMAAFLGYGNCEVFPKQTSLLIERGDIGQWINMPYFKEHETLRYGYGDNGKPIKLKRFLQLASDARMSPDDLRDFAVPTSDALPDGPPCLRILVSQGFPEGTRNNGLFNLGVYARKSNPDGWQADVETLNKKHMDPPLDSSEVIGILKSLQKSDYEYTCKSEPIQSFCNAAECRTCKFGIGTGTGMPTLGTLTKLNTEPPIWFIDVEDMGRLELTTEDLQNQTRFQRRCMDVLNKMPSMVKREVWETIMQKLFENMHVVEMPVDSTPMGQLWDHIETFCTGRVQGSRIEDMLLGKPWLNNGYHHFRIKDLMSYLDRVKFFEFKSNRITMAIKDKKGKHHFFNIRGKGVNCWAIPEVKMLTESLELPEQSDKSPF